MIKVFYNLGTCSRLTLGARETNEVMLAALSGDFSWGTHI